MDWVKISLLIILAIAIIEGLYILIKTQRRRILSNELERNNDETFIRIQILDAIRLGFGFTLGFLFSILLLFLILYILKLLHITLPFNLDLLFSSALSKFST